MHNVVLMGSCFCLGRRVSTWIGFGTVAYQSSGHSSVGWWLPTAVRFTVTVLLEPTRHDTRTLRFTSRVKALLIPFCSSAWRASWGVALLVTGAPTIWRTTSLLSTAMRLERGNQWEGMQGNNTRKVPEWKIGYESHQDIDVPGRQNLHLDEVTKLKPFPILLGDLKSRRLAVSAAFRNARRSLVPTSPPQNFSNCTALRLLVLSKYFLKRLSVTRWISLSSFNLSFGPSQLKPKVVGWMSTSTTK